MGAEIFVGNRHLLWKVAAGKSAAPAEMAKVAVGDIFFDQTANKLDSGVVVVELELEQVDIVIGFEDGNRAREWLDTCTNGFGKYLELVGKPPELDTELDGGKIEDDTERFGFHVAVTSIPDMTASELMAACRGRDPMGSPWRAVEGNPPTAGTDPAAQGRLFIVWGAAILRRLVADSLEKAGLDMTVDGAILATKYACSA